VHRLAEQSHYRPSEWQSGPNWQVRRPLEPPAPQECVKNTASRTKTDTRRLGAASGLAVGEKMTIWEVSLEEVAEFARERADGHVGIK